MRTLPDFLAIIVATLRDATALRAYREAARAPLYLMLGNYFARTVERFARLHARWRAGTLPTSLPAPRPSRATPSATPGAIKGATRATPKPRLPTRRAWLLALVQLPSATANSQLRALIAQPDLADFLHAAPQAARLLRPLLRMLSTDPMPAALALPPRPPRPARVRPPRPARPRPPAPDRPPSPRRLRQIIGRPRFPDAFPLRPLRKPPA